MGLKQTGAAPACHKSQGPTLPACEKRDLNPRNPFSWVRRLLTLWTLFPHSHFPPKPLNQQHTKYLVTTLPEATFLLHTYLYLLTLFWRASGILFSYYQSSIASLKFVHLPFSNIPQLTPNTLSHEHIDIHVIHPNPHQPIHPSPSNFFKSST